jgi:transcription initiation factor IIF auxiliary subunit
MMGGFLGLLLVSLTSDSLAQGLSIANTSRYLGLGRWEWTVYVKAQNEEALNGIRCVEYTLPASLFTDPVRSVCSRGDTRYPFGFTGQGVGSFEISIKITLANGTVDRLTHKMALVALPVTSPLPITAGNVATQLQPGWWEWTVFIQGPEDALNQIQCVQYTLHPTFPHPVRDVCIRGTSSQAFALTATGWGTFQIRIRMFLKNGRVQDLTHDLTF